VGVITETKKIIVPANAAFK